MADRIRWTPPARTRDLAEPDNAAARLLGRWRRGEAPDVEDFLARSGLVDLDEIVAVLRIDLSERLRLGQRARVEAYLDAFPTVANDPEQALDLIFAEYLLREEQGERPGLEEFLGRFPHHARELKLQLDLHAAIETHPDPHVDAPEPTALTGDDGDPIAAPDDLPAIPGYEVLGVVGRGGMGIVYRAWQRGLNRLVAIKMVHAGAQAGPAVRARFRVEAEAAARLRHPHIVQVHDVGQHAGAPFLVLELVEGQTLAKQIAGTPQPDAWAAELVETLSRATHAAHEEGVVHRDLTPSNILISAEGMPKITDFGLAKLLVGAGDLRTATGELLGTPSYMAPEQADGRHATIGPAADVYALGAILYELLTGRPPFKAESPLETLRQVALVEPVSPSRLRPRLPRDLETIVLKCVRKDPARRYARALELAEDLRRYREGRPIRARRGGSFERAWRWCRRNPGLAAVSLIAAAAVLSLAVAAPLATWTFRDQRDRIAHDLALMRLSEARERRARLDGRLQLFEALDERARAQRRGRHVGQRFDSLEAIRQAVAIARELKLPPERLDPLRDEMIACLAVPDLRPDPGSRIIPRPAEAEAFAFDPGLTRLAFAFRDGTISVRRLADDGEVARFLAPGDNGFGVFAFSPDGRYLAAARGPGEALSVWDVDRREAVVTDPGPVHDRARFSPDSRRIALARASAEVVVYDLTTGRPVRRWRVPSPGTLSFRPDGARLAVLSSEKGNACRILETETGRLVREIALNARGSGVQWSPDGSTLTTPCGNRMIYLWDAGTGALKATLRGHAHGGLGSTFHPTGTLLASNGWEGRLVLWDPVLGHPWLDLPGATNHLFGRDGRIVVSFEHRLTTYRVDPALEYRTFAPAGHEAHEYGEVAIRSDGRVLALGTNRGVALWDLARVRELAFLPIGDAQSVLFEASGDLLTGGTSGVWRWPVRLDPDRREFGLGPPRRLPLPAGIEQIAEDRSGRVVALAGLDFAHVSTPERTFRVGPLVGVKSVAVSPDGEYLATGCHGSDGVRVWRLRDSAPLAHRQLTGFVGVAFSPDGRWLLTMLPPCRVWEVGTWREVWRFNGRGRCFSPDGRLVVVSDPGKVLHLLEAATGRTLARLTSPDLSEAWSARFSPDASWLAVSTRDGPAVHVWDLRAIRCHLAELGLDWDAPAFSDNDSAGRDAPPLPPVQIDYGALAGRIAQSVG
jgi:WD40 repeat protein